MKPELGLLRNPPPASELTQEETTVFIRADGDYQKMFDLASKIELEMHGGWGNYSKGGFLGRGEGLLEVVHGDEETVRNLGVTHDEIADRIEYFIKSYRFGEKDIIDDKYEVNADGYMGMQECPWEDPADYGAMDYSVKNLRLNETLSFPGLIVHLIRAHHFYEGRKSPYRVDPVHAVRVLDLKQ